MSVAQAVPQIKTTHNGKYLTRAYYIGDVWAGVGQYLDFHPDAQVEVWPTHINERGLACAYACSHDLEAIRAIERVAEKRMLYTSRAELPVEADGDILFA